MEFTLLGQRILATDNIKYSLGRYRLWWLILIVTMGFDILTTSAFTTQHGIVAEGNLTTRGLMYLFGPTIGNILGKLLQLTATFGFVCLHRRLGNLFLLIVILLNCWAVVINSFP
jgi:hypothetical protein